MKITDLITHPEPITIDDDDSVSLALQTMLWSDIRHLPVLRDGLLVGIVSERDLLAHEARRGRAGRGDLVSTMMTTPVITASPGTTLDQARTLMLERRLGCLPVVDGRALVGIVTRSDLLRASHHEARAADANGAASPR